MEKLCERCNYVYSKSAKPNKCDCGSFVAIVKNPEGSFYKYKEVCQKCKKEVQLGISLEMNAENGYRQVLRETDLQLEKGVCASCL